MFIRGGHRFKVDFLRCLATVVREKSVVVCDQADRCRRRDIKSGILEVTVAAAVPERRDASPPRSCSIDRIKILLQYCVWIFLFYVLEADSDLSFTKTVREKVIVVKKQASFLWIE